MRSSQLLPSLLVLPFLHLSMVPRGTQAQEAVQAPAPPSAADPAPAVAEGLPPPPLGPLPSGFPTPADAQPEGVAPPPTAGESTPVTEPPRGSVPAAVAPAAAAPVSPPAPTPAPPSAAEVTLAPVADSGAIPRPGTNYRPGQGFVLTTEDGDFALSIAALGQARYRFRDGTDLDPHHLADVRHARLRLGGHLFGATNRFFLQLAFAPAEVGRAAVPVPTAGEEARALDLVADSPLMDMFLRFDQLRDANLQVGQFRVPFSRTRLLAPEHLLLLDRGLVNDTFNLERDIGAMLFSEDLLGLDLLRYWVGVFIGEGRNASAATTGAGDRGFLVTARAEVLPMGTFDTANVVDFDRSDSPRVAFGVGYGSFEGDAASPASASFLGVQRLGSDESALVDFSAHNVTVDALFKLMGFSAQAALHVRQVDPIPASANGIGVELTAGYLLAPVPVSFGVRAGFVRISKEDSSLPEQDELSFAISYHIFENQLKAQVGFSHVWTRSVSDDPILARALGLATGESSALTLAVTAAL